MNMDARGSTTPSEARSPAEGTEQDAIRADIEKTRAELGQTVHELAEMADVRARIQRKASGIKDQAVIQVRRHPGPYAGVATLALAVVAAVLVRRRAARSRARRYGWWST
jgi:hypothetical protein